MFRKTVTVRDVFKSVFAIIFATLILNLLFTHSTHAYQLTVRSSGDTIIEFQNGQIKTKTSQLTVQTDCRAGYTLQIQGPTDPNLYLDSDATKNETGKFIGPASSSSSLSAQPNTYGYSLVSNQTNQIFNPLTNTLTTLKDLQDTASSTTDINETTNIHWGVHAGFSLDAGTYQMANSGAVNYIVTTSPTCANYTVNFNANGGAGTMTPQEIQPNTPTTLTPNAFTSPESWQSFNGWNTAPDGSGTSYTDEQSVTNLTNGGETVTLYAQWLDCSTKNKICYDDNGANSPTKMGEQNVSSTTTRVALWLSNFQYSGYGFLGWNTKPDGTGTNYGPNETITDTATLDTIKNQGLRLFANWKASAGNLQNWSGCNAMNIGDATALTDSRDNNTYSVAKLADGNCWITENLRLGSDAPMTLTPTDSDIASDFILPASTDPRQTPWCEASDDACLNQPIQNSTATLETESNMTGFSNGKPYYSYGSAYNWYTATAGSGTTSVTSGNAEYSICPKGWHLPTGGRNSEMATLDKALGGAGTGTGQNGTFWATYPNNFTVSTSVSKSSLSFSNILVFWSSTAMNGASAVMSYVYPTQGSVGFVGARTKSHGGTIHCLAHDYYTVSFDANGGSGDMVDQSIQVGIATKLSANTFTNTESFVGWNTKPDGTGDSYTNEQEVTDLVGKGETITLYAQWDCGANKICYDDNGANSSTKMSAQSASAYSDITLMPSNFQRAGYGFAGWSPDKDAATKLADPANSLTNPVIYGPVETITTPSTLDTKGLTLYAVWIQSAGDMQSWRGCDNLSIGQVTALKDTRDNQTYAVAKLADGACWAIENLRLDNSATITAVNTDYPADGFALPDSANPATDSSAWCISYNSDCVNQASSNSENTTDTVADASNTNSNIYSYGNYYNWYSATAGNGTYDHKNGVASGSICPAGWHLATTKSTEFSDMPGGFYYLSQQLGGTTANIQTSEALLRSWRTYPNNIIYAGIISSAGINSRGGTANYWTSVAFPNSSVNATNVNMNSSNNRIALSSGTYRYYGLSVRCVARDYYTIAFNANGGTGDMPSQSAHREHTITLDQNTFSKSGEKFNSWNTKADGTGDTYYDKDEVLNLANKNEIITLYAQWGCPPNKICYDDNGANSLTTMRHQVVNDSDTSVMLWPSNFQRSGYGFAGWNTKTDGTGTMYGPNETIEEIATMASIKSDGLTLYATWIQSAGDLQGWQGCDAMNVGSVTALTDKRDNQTYAIAKYADNKCWMIENLRLDNQYTTGTENIALSQGYGENFIGLANPETTNFASTAAANSLYATDDSREMKIAGSTASVRFPRYNNSNTSQTVKALDSWDGTQNVYSLGNYYAWPAAVATTAELFGGNTTVADTSICPTGWRLPIGGNKNNEANNEVWNLIVNHLNNGVLPSNYETASQNRPEYIGDGGELQKVMAKYPNNFIYAGTYDKNKPENRKTIGRWWTATVSETAYSHSFGMVSYSQSVSPGTSIMQKYVGTSMRCVAR